MEKKDQEGAKVRIYWGGSRQRRKRKIIQWLRRREMQEKNCYMQNNRKQRLNLNQRNTWKMKVKWKGGKAFKPNMLRNRFSIFGSVEEENSTNNQDIILCFQVWKCWKDCKNRLLLLVIFARCLSPVQPKCSSMTQKIYLQEKKGKKSCIRLGIKVSVFFCVCGSDVNKHV